MRKHVPCAVLIVLSLAPDGASADTVTWNGDIVEGNSWSTSFVATGFGGIDFLGIRVTGGGALEGPVFFNFSDPGWDNYADYGEFPTIAAAAGPSFSNLSFRLRFAGDAPDPISYDLVFFDGDIIRSVFSFAWNGVSFGIGLNGSTYDLGRGDFETAGVPPMVPLPPGAGLAGVGLLTVATRRRRRGV